jgi:hypothetical protein
MNTDDCVKIAPQNIYTLQISTTGWFLRRRGHVFHCIGYCRPHDGDLKHRAYDTIFLDEIERVRNNITPFMYLLSASTYACRNWPLPSFAHAFATRLCQLNEEARAIPYDTLIKSLHSIFIMSGRGNIINAVCAESQKLSPDGRGAVFMPLHREPDQVEHTERSCLCCIFALQVQRAARQFQSRDAVAISDSRPHVQAKRNELAGMLQRGAALGWLVDALDGVVGHRNCKPIWQHVLATYDYANPLLIEYMHWDFNSLWHYRGVCFAAAVVLKKMANSPGYSERVASFRATLDDIQDQFDMQKRLSEADINAAFSPTFIQRTELALRLFGGTAPTLRAFLNNAHNEISQRLQRGGTVSAGSSGIKLLRKQGDIFVSEKAKNQRGSRERSADRWKSSRTAHANQLSDEERAQWEADRLECSIELLFDTARSLPEACRTDIVDAYGDAVAALANDKSEKRFLLSYHALTNRVSADELEKRGILPPSKYDQGLRAVSAALECATALMAAELIGTVPVSTRDEAVATIKAAVVAKGINLDEITDPIRSITLRHYGRERGAISDWLHSKTSAPGAHKLWNTRRANEAAAIVEQRAAQDDAHASTTAQRDARVKRKSAREGATSQQPEEQPITWKTNKQAPRAERLQAQTAADSADKPDVKRRRRAPAAVWTEAENARLFELILEHGTDNEPIAQGLAALRPATSAKAVKSHRVKFSDIALQTIWTKYQAKQKK